MLIAVLGVGTLSAQTDVTSTYLTNADLSKLDGWTRSDYTDWKTDGDANVIEFYHTWSSNPGAAIGNTKDFHFKQTVTLPAGEYRLSVNAFYREGNGNGTNTKAYIHAGEQQQYVAAFSPGDLDSYTGSNDLYKAANAFSKGAFANAFDFTVETETTMEIGFKGYIDTYCSWCILGPVKLFQYSMDDFNNELLEAKTKLQGLTGLNTAMQARLDAMLTETENVAQTKAAILEATAKVNALYDELVECLGAHESVIELLEECANYIGSSTPATNKDLEDFTVAYEQATADIDGAANLEEINTVYTALEAARQVYVVNAIPTNSTTFDLTFKVVNPTFDVNTNGWLNASHQYNNQPDEIFNPPYAERWAASSYVGTIEQTVTELPIGAYTVKVAAFRDQLITGASDQDAVYVFGNDAETLVSHATPTMYTVENILTYDGKITLGIKSKVANYKWMGIDNVSLLYVGKTLAFCDEALQQAITKAETVKETLNTAVKETFAQKIAIAKAAKEDANRTIASVEEAAAELVEATDLANSIAQAYAKVNALVSTCTGYATNSTPAATVDLTTFNNAITEATADKETATTVEALNSVYNELETARQTYALKAYPTGDTTFDMTFLVDGVGNTTTGWTKNFSDDFTKNYQYQNNNEKDTETLKKQGYIEAWNNSVAFTGTLTYKAAGLPNGYYSVSAYAFTDGTTSFTAQDKNVVVEKTSMYVKPIVEGVLVNDGTLTFGLENETGTWIGITNIELQLTGDLTAKEHLACSIKEASSMTRDISGKLFEISENAVTVFTQARAEAQAVYDKENATNEEYAEANVALQAAIDTYKEALSARFYITVATAGHGKEGFPIAAALGNTGANNPTGYSLSANVKSEHRVFVLTLVKDDLYNISFKMNGETVYLTYGSLNGSAAGWATQQIQATPFEINRGEFKIEPTEKTGIYKIYNPIHKAYIDCQAGGSLYTDTEVAFEEFALIAEDNTELTSDIVVNAANKIATCVLKFNATLPAGLKAYTTGKLVDNNLTLVEADKLEAYTPYILYAENGFTGTVKGDIVWNGYNTKVADENNFVGAVTAQTITTGYALQNQGEGVKFYAVDTEKSQKVTIPAGKCWLDVVKGSTPAATTRSINLSFPGDETTGMKAMEIPVLIENGEIYTIDGKRVETMQSGKIYIIGGQKVIKK